MLKALTKLQTRIATRDKGATAVEYGLLVALIAAVIVAIVLVLGRQVSTAFNSVSTRHLTHPAGASARGNSSQRVASTAAPMVLSGYGAATRASQRI